MKNVRLFYKKQGTARFMSHLDTMRFMTRLLRRTGLPVWYTEGFNPHLYITFALPLSLGFESEYEIADIRLTDDSFPLENVCRALNQNCPDGFLFFKAADPVCRLSDLAFAEFNIFLDDKLTLYDALNNFLKKDEVLLEKKTKKGDIKLINAADDIKYSEVKKDGGTKLKIILPAGNNKNINPDLIIKKFLSENGSDVFYKIVRVSLLKDDLKPLE